MKTFATVCSGIGAPEVAASRLGWQCLFGADIEPFPNAVRAHHWPKVPNLGDMTKVREWPHKCICPTGGNRENGENHVCKKCGGIGIDVLIAGTPCQAFSVAGLRAGLADPRGNLTLTFLGVIERYAPRWVLWENVPGVLSDKTGAFGTFLGGLAELGYGFAYRILDAQYFGVAQRRRRVFVVAHSGGEWQRAAAVLFERESLCGNPPPRREAGEGAAPTISARTQGGGGLGTDCECDGGLIASATAHALKAEGFDASEDGAGRGIALIPEVVGCLSDGAHNGGGLNGQDAYSGRIIPGGQSMAVRRLTPRECERLQGFPDDFTAIQFRGKPAADGPRYRALGYSMAVPVIEWILRRIDLVDELVPVANPAAVTNAPQQCKP